MGFCIMILVASCKVVLRRLGPAFGVRKVSRSLGVSLVEVNLPQYSSDESESARKQQGETPQARKVNSARSKRTTMTDNIDEQRDHPQCA